MSLRWRIALALAVIAGIVGTLAAAGAYLATARGLQSSVDDALEVRARDIYGAGVRGRPGPGRPPQLDCPPIDALRGLWATQVVTATGDVTVCGPGPVTLPVNPEDLAEADHRGSMRFATVEVDGHEYRVVTLGWGNGSAIQIARDLNEATSVLTGLRDRLVAIVGAAVLAAAGLGWMVARRMVRPVVRLRDSAESIAATQDLATPVPSGGSGEVGSLARSFTTMVEALAASRDQQQRLISDASHEMRTPLTSLRTNLELLERLEEMGDDDRRAALEAVVADVGELTHMLTELVELSSDPTRDEPAEEATLEELAEEVAARARRRSRRTIVVTAEEPVLRLLVRTRMVQRAIANLVDNALKYSSADSTVDVRVRGPEVEVRDQGPGIAEADLPHVFDRFFRSDAARTEPGSGLGLAIVAHVAERHGGATWARNDPQGGAVVGFSVSPAGKGGVRA